MGTGAAATIVVMIIVLSIVGIWYRVFRRFGGGRMKNNYMKNLKRKKKIQHIAANILLFIIVIFTIFPIVWMFISSLMTQNNLAAGKITDITHWENYIEMWNNIDFFKYFKNSLIVCSITTIIALIIATFAGYSIARFKFPGSGLFGTAVLSTQMIPGIMFCFRFT